MAKENLGQNIISDGPITVEFDPQIRKKIIDKIAELEAPRDQDDSDQYHERQIVIDALKKILQDTPISDNPRHQIITHMNEMETFFQKNNLPYKPSTLFIHPAYYQKLMVDPIVTTFAVIPNTKFAGLKIVVTDAVKFFEIGIRRYEIV